MATMMAAEHQHFTMRHVDDAHEAETQSKTQRRQDEQGGDGEAVENLAEEKRGFVHSEDPRNEWAVGLTSCSRHGAKTMVDGGHCAWPPSFVKVGR
jgi:hypothetical protein